MDSARTQCPDCGGVGPEVVVDLADLLYSSRVDYFRCRACGCWWLVQKGEEGPATRAVIGKPVAAALAKRAG
jgi:hypothetical protein